MDNVLYSKKWRRKKKANKRIEELVRKKVIEKDVEDFLK